MMDPDSDFLKVKNFRHMVKYWRQVQKRLLKLKHTNQSDWTCLDRSLVCHIQAGNLNMPAMEEALDCKWIYDVKVGPSIKPCDSCTGCELTEDEKYLNEKYAL